MHEVVVNLRKSYYIGITEQIAKQARAAIIARVLFDLSGENRFHGSHIGFSKQ